MPRYRDALPQLSDKPFLTDGGLETTLVFHDGIALPAFAAIDLMKTADGRARLAAYYERYAGIAVASRAGFIFESPTWRASRDWAATLGLSQAGLLQAGRDSITLMAALREALETPASPMVISGCIGPRGDGYVPGARISAAEAESYHREQIRALAETEADMIAALTMNSVEEAIGIAWAAGALGMPSVISFTLETDGRLPTGQPLGEAIEAVDDATGSAPAYFMINCAHPTHFEGMLAGRPAWAERIRGLRANASKRSHAELDAASDLDDGDPAELGREYRALLEAMPWINVLGGCCGTDHRHVEAIAHSCVTHRARAHAA